MRKRMRMFKVGVKRAKIAREIVAALHRRNVRTGCWGKKIFVEAPGAVQARELVERTVREIE